ncbi:MAG: hypothetical protein CO150_01675 [Nitrospirae bacterium CG_4_9_14_3_um_filter_53_35]|nr:MAG: hypothetical protein AUK29_01475 [Nitrospirae bacterium CG2_30_53_67]PIS37724.1 MAG: hypothetical protein COT35_04545 [Nitrospirae bacterium CG08_land_8_20_14_0_20_52_24]PIV82844.1 MAG: hypothetical protein COW52_11425 [Nitrospirae bacterium CG17_big_fil_post_rev_8_21_14_2_50_50_9]PIW86212.1 MAG: hypothetical protein COZ95_00470 [Nitrospirae bacterium CG_4_8_14_3_um_filter_50_41]PIX85320.1 MAG: hypothetical protein COZ32_09100 [Nitrospirae bacterium CG_4_10_14_3_um_filter_53_41]PJA7728
MKNNNEIEKRCKAIEIYNQGIGFNEILKRVQRSRFWLWKWLKRHQEQGIEDRCPVWKTWKQEAKAKQP